MFITKLLLGVILLLIVFTTIQVYLGDFLKKIHFFRWLFFVVDIIILIVSGVVLLTSNWHSKEFLDQIQIMIAGFTGTISYIFFRVFVKAYIIPNKE